MSNYKNRVLSHNISNPSEEDHSTQYEGIFCDLYYYLHRDEDDRRH